jgi:hypothetical protein
MLLHLVYRTCGTRAAANLWSFEIVIVKVSLPPGELNVTSELGHGVHSFTLSDSKLQICRPLKVYAVITVIADL